MPALQLPRQAEALRAWLAEPTARDLLLRAQSSWIERSGADGAGGQIWLRLLPELDWPLPAPRACFADAWSLMPEGGRWVGAWRAGLDVLPLVTASVSRIDLRFVLEVVPEPERLLSECARVLLPEGRLLVFGLNPWGIARMRWARHRLSALPRSRVVDCLRAEGLEVLGQRTLGPRWGWGGEGAVEERARVELGRVAWAVLAARRDVGLTPLRRAPAAWRGSPGVPAA